MKSSDVSGQAYALTVMCPIERGAEADLRAYLEGLPQGDGQSPLAKLPRTHFGRWVIVEDFVTEDGKEDHLASQYLLFTSNFDGPRDSYLDELCDVLSVEAEQIWGRCLGSPSPANGEALKRYLVHNQLRTGFFVAAYGHATVQQVKSALDQRERMIDFAVRAQAMEAAELQRAFLAEFA